jgi:integrative and conjugative element protein (TIGR02256 family)
LVSSGSIIIRKDETIYFPILIVYPKATPYIPPEIYILEKPISKANIEAFTKLEPDLIRDQLSGNKKIFNRRHQGIDGKICFYESQDAHNDNAEAFCIKDILNRIRLWLSGQIPVDSREVDLFSHFPNQAHDIQALMTDIFFDDEIIKGEFYFAISKAITVNRLDDIGQRKTYIGVFIVGENENALSISPKIYKNDKLVLFAGIPNPDKLILDEKRGEINELLTNGELIKGYWWNIIEEPTPFSSVMELAKYIGNGNIEKGYTEITSKFGAEIRNIVDSPLYVGIRYPIRPHIKEKTRSKEWQTLRLVRIGNRTPIIPCDENELIERLSDYRIEAVKSDYITDEYYHLRNTGIVERQGVRDECVSIIGCGALGSEIADCISKAGVGNVLLIDKENINTHNAIRHVVGFDNLNLPKSLGLARHIAFHNPFVNVLMDKYCIDILKADINSYLPSEFIGISTIADDSTEAYLNAQAVEANRIVFYGRALRGGKVGRIFRVVPHKDACKNCLALYKMDGNDILPIIEEDPDLPVIANECNNPIRPASAADLKLISSIISKIVINHVQGNDDGANHWIWTTESLLSFDVSPKRPGLIHATYIPPHPDCTVCKRIADAHADIKKDVLEFMRSEISKSPAIETGGILIGTKNNLDYSISLATGPGPNAEKKRTHFLRDTKFCQDELDNAITKIGQSVQYIGEWHYHTTGGNLPSGIDIQSLTAIAKQDNYQIDNPIMIILSPQLEHSVTIHSKDNMCVEISSKIIG